MRLSRSFRMVWVMALASPGVLFVSVIGWAYSQDTHNWITELAIELAGVSAECSPIHDAHEDLKDAVGAVDTKRDVELVKVHFGLDNPHVEEALTYDDTPSTADSSGMIYSAFNHFIDIHKADSGQTARFDDYDGYSYEYGGGRLGEYQPASDSISIEGIASFFAAIGVIGMNVDEAVNWYLNDRYVHARPHEWYRDCSPALVWYSFPDDKGKYHSVNDELAARFPRAESTGEEGKGVPYSVFMPVDNMARYWFGRFDLASKDSQLHLAYVLHAVQDATVPHHAAGTLGNWHGGYEEEFDVWVEEMKHPEKHPQLTVTKDMILSSASQLLLEWRTVDASPPGRLGIGDWKDQGDPRINWRVDLLVTWLALNSWGEYVTAYNRFRDGFSQGLYLDSCVKLMVQAVAMSALVIEKALVDPCVTVAEGAEKHVESCSITVGGVGCSYVVKAGAEVEFLATESIRLLPGFHAEAGASFRARLRE